MYNLSKAKTKDQEELEELRRLLMEDQSKLGFMGKYGKLLAIPTVTSRRFEVLQKRKMYRKTRVHKTSMRVVSSTTRRPFE